MKSCNCQHRENLSQLMSCEVLVKIYNTDSIKNLFRPWGPGKIIGFLDEPGMIFEREDGKKFYLPQQFIAIPVENKEGSNELTKFLS